MHDENGVAVDRIALLVPRTEYTIIDDWYVFGLCGTGSKSLEMKDVFVPEYRTHSLSAYQLNDRPSSYLHPFGTIFCGSVSAASLQPKAFRYSAVDRLISRLKSLLYFLWQKALHHASHGCCPVRGASMALSSAPSMRR